MISNNPPQTNKNLKTQQKHMETPFAQIGIILILAGIIFLVISAISGTDIKSGGGAVIFIGPIPIALGTDKKWALTALIIGIIIYILFIIYRNKIY